jgi:hypothetical protein
MGKVKRKAEKAAKSALGQAPAAKQAAKGSSKSLRAAIPARQEVSKVLKESSSVWRNREKPLILCARGITYRYRHLMTDLMQLIPHHKTDSKLDTKHDWNVINEVAELKVRQVNKVFKRIPTSWVPVPRLVPACLLGWHGADGR